MADPVNRRDLWVQFALAFTQGNRGDMSASMLAFHAANFADEMLNKYDQRGFGSETTFSEAEAAKNK